MSDAAVPKDSYSSELRAKQANPSAVEKTSTVDLVDFYGNAETWIVKTIRVDGADTVFLQRNGADGGDRWVLPPGVTAAMTRHRDGIADVNRRRGARQGAATRRAKASS